MIVFGDRIRAVDPRALLAGIEDRIAVANAMPAGIVRHGALVAAMVDAGGLVQGLADEVQARNGSDDLSADVTRAAILLRALAQATVESWRTGFMVTSPVATPQSPRDLPSRIDLRTPEGFAFYAVYPEAYATAALRFRTVPCRVVGLRSIGTTLAAMVAVVVDADPPHTLRPVGHPFTRTVCASARLRRAIASERSATHLVVDEGPGASGSSLCATAEFLEASGIAPDRIVFLPSHTGSPGAMASAAHRLRWERTRRTVVTFDELSLEARQSEHQLAAWFEDLVGPPVAPLADLSGGGWREAARRVEAPCVAGFERRKFLLRTETGTWLLKFAGLGQIGEEKFDLARRLHAAGFYTEPLGLRHGFLIERWHADATCVGPERRLLASYIGWRVRHLPASDADGAALQTLCDMARHNVAERFGEAAAARLRLDPGRPTGRRIRIDGRLHSWEWLRLPDGRILKADALDHHCAHDLIGCQEVGWDIAGAIVELDLSAEQGEMLRREVEALAGYDIDPQKLSTLVTCYCAFQLGLWAGSDTARAHVRRYERRLSPPPYPP